MNQLRRWKLMSLALMVFLLCGAGQVLAGNGNSTTPPGQQNAAGGSSTQLSPTVNLRSTTNLQRQKAAAARKAASQTTVSATALVAPSAVVVPGGTPDYFGTTPNYANSQLPTLNPLTGAITGGIRKFIDTLPGLALTSAAPTPGNTLGQYIPVAVADTTTFPAAGATPAADYYEIGLVEYKVRMSTDLPATGTIMRGYVQIETAANAASSKHIALTYPNGSPILNAAGTQVYAVEPPQYMGPVILTQSNRPVRIKFTNYLPTGPSGNLSIPVDTTCMGAGMGPLSATEMYTQNRATVHLHGGKSPWISDGTPHQWTVPAGETTLYPRGASVGFVPDMWFDSFGNLVPAGTAGASNDPGPGSLTFYYTNQQSARLMFYHDHAYGITRLNVYAGEAAGYIIADQVEEDLISGTNVSGANPGLVKAIPDLGGVYHHGVPLIIQDKTFVPDPVQLAAEDPTWNWGGQGNLWFPHVYMTNQNPASPDGTNACGRWDYGPWFWPPFNAAAGVQHVEVPNPYYVPGTSEGPTMPGTPNPSLVPEAFVDTPIVNGTAYPTMPVTRGAYRFRILNACNDRTLNLSLWYADPVGATIINGGTGYSATPTVTLSGGGATTQATASATVTNVVNAVAVGTGGAGYTSAPTVNFTGGGGAGATAVATITGGAVTAVTVVTGGAGYTAAPTVSFSGGGATTAATATATITGTVTGINILTAPVPSYTSAPTITITDATGTGALAIASPNTEVRMIPANPGPAIPPFYPTMDGRAGGVPDPTMSGPNFIQIASEGGFLPEPYVVPNRPVGYDYNRRSITVLNVLEKALFLGPAERADVIVDFSQVPAGVNKVIVYNDAPAPVPAFDSRIDYFTGDPDQTSTGGAPTTLPGYGPNTRTVMRFDLDTAAAQPPFNLAALQTVLPAAFAAGQPTPIVPETTYPAPNTPAADTYSKISDTSLTFTPIGSGTPVTMPMLPKAIQELFELNYGRMNATLGVELPFTNAGNQTTVPLGYTDPPTEILQNGQIQIWKITHNGVDTHAIHFHLFDVQLINRVGWDGMIKPPNPNELGWKDTVIMNPLEDCIVAFRPNAPTLPFSLPDSVRPLNPTMPLGSTYPSFDPLTGGATTVTNVLTNFGWEYVVHCHLLGHEENDMMRPMVLQYTAATVPSAPLIGTAVAGNASATVNFAAPMSDGGSPILSYTATAYIAGVPAGITATAGAGPITVTGLTNGTTYTFTVTATNAIGTGPASAMSNAVTPATIPNPPVIGVATGGNASAVVNFTAPASNGGSPITSYTATAYVNGVSAGITGTLLGATAAPISVTGLTNGTTYTFAVTATNALGTSLPSAMSNAVTPAPTVPGAPVIGTATPGNAQATVTYTAPATDGGSPILSYTATAYIGGVSTGITGTSTGATPAPITVTGLTNGTTYTLAVTATNAVGTSLPSAMSNAVTPATVPDAPTGVTATPGNAQATVNFTAPVFNGGSVILSYTATSSPGGLTGTLTGATAGPITVTGLTNGVAYTFTVTATNAVGTSVPSAASAAVTPYTVPNAPTGVTATATNLLTGGGAASVTFSAPAFNGGSAITGYTVTSNPAGGADTNAGSTALTHTITGLTNGTPYTFTVVATNIAGNSVPSAPSNSVTPMTLPGAPTGVVAVGGNASATVTFSAPASNGGSAIIGYTATSSPGGFTGMVFGATPSTITVNGLKNGTTYTFTVTATNSVGTGPASAPSNAVKPGSGKPATPTSFTATANTAGNPPSVTLSWVETSNQTGFTLQRSLSTSWGGATSIDIPGTARTYVDTAVTAGTKYYYRIRAYNAVGTSGWSTVKNATPQ